MLFLLTWAPETMIDKSERIVLMPTSVSLIRSRQRVETSTLKHWSTLRHSAGVDS